MNWLQSTGSAVTAVNSPTNLTALSPTSVQQQYQQPGSSTSSPNLRLNTTYPPAVAGPSGSTNPQTPSCVPPMSGAVTVHPQQPEPPDLPHELINAGWRKFWSKREQRIYFWNKTTGESLWDMPPPVPTSPAGVQQQQPAGVQQQQPAGVQQQSPGLQQQPAGVQQQSAAAAQHLQQFQQQAPPHTAATPGPVSQNARPFQFIWLMLCSRLVLSCAFAS